MSFYAAFVCQFVKLSFSYKSNKATIITNSEKSQLKSSEHFRQQLRKNAKYAFKVNLQSNVYIDDITLIHILPFDSWAKYLCCIGPRMNATWRSLAEGDEGLYWINNENKFGYWSSRCFDFSWTKQLATWAETSLPLSAAGKKLPNVYKSYPKMISLKMKDFDIFTKIA